MTTGLLELCTTYSKTPNFYCSRMSLISRYVQSSITRPGSGLSSKFTTNAGDANGSKNALNQWTRGSMTYYSELQSKKGR